MAPCTLTGARVTDEFFFKPPVGHPPGSDDAASLDALAASVRDLFFAGIARQAGVPREKGKRWSRWLNRFSLSPWGRGIEGEGNE